MAQYPFGSLDLSDKYIVHDVTLYAHNHATQPDGINAAVKAIETALQAFDIDAYVTAGGGSGDMEKNVYDTDDSGIVDGAEQLDDGTNTVTAAAMRDHLDNHPAGDSVGGYVEISSSRALLASELEGHLILVTGVGTVLDLPDSTTLPDNARCDIIAGAATIVQLDSYDNGKGGADNIMLPGSQLSDGAILQSTGTVGDCIRLRKGPAGWIAVQNTGFSEYTGG